MNEKRIREVIEVEKQALELLAQANREAERIPIEAEMVAREMIDSARTSAQEEARRMIEQAKTEGRSDAIISRANDVMGERAKLAEANLERAVAYVLERLVGGA